jgi:hypothetical protein
MATYRQMPAKRVARTDTIAAPEITPVKLQVRTGSSAQVAPHMRTIDGSAPVVITLQQQRNRDSLGAHAEELLRKRVMISPVVVTWRYAIADSDAFLDWLLEREILLSEARMFGDAELAGIRYGGTYRLSDDVDAETGTYQTIWGFTSEQAMRSMQRLCSDASIQATPVQIELIDFVKGLREFIARAGEAKFSQEVMVSAAMAHA